MQTEFQNFIEELTGLVKHTDSVPSDFSVADSRLVLKNVAKIAALVEEEIKSSFPEKRMTTEDLEAVLRLETALRAIRGSENIRLVALEKFAALEVANASS